MTTWQLAIDCNDPARLVAFWAPLLGYEVQPAPDGFDTWNDWYRSVGVPEDELDADGDGSDRIHDPDGHGPNIWFQVVPEPKTVKNRLHLDIYVAERRTTPYDVRKPLVEAKVAMLQGLGATIRNVHDDPEQGFYSTVMFDPEGNEFCVG
ncbi:MAG: VOC family protein [Marmoricola sp.]